jgi:hypothetical protein
MRSTHNTKELSQASLILSPKNLRKKKEIGGGYTTSNGGILSSELLKPYKP